MPPDEEEGPEVQPEGTDVADATEEVIHPPPDERNRPIMDTTYENGYSSRVFGQHRRTREPGAAEAFEKKRAADEDLMLRLMGVR